MWSAVAIRSKEDRQELYNFYVDQLHPDSPGAPTAGAQQEET